MMVKQQLYRLGNIASTPTTNGLIPVSRNTIWRWVKAGYFPAPRKIGPRTTVWDASAVDEFIRTHNQEVSA